MSWLRRATEGIAGIVDDTTSPFIALQRRRDQEDADREEVKKKAEADRVAKSAKERIKAARRLREDNFPQNVAEAEEVQRLNQGNATHATGLQRGTMETAGGIAEDMVETVGEENRATIDSTFKGQGELDTTRAQAWTDVTVPGIQSIMNTQHGQELAVMDRLTGATPLVESLIANERAREQHDLALVDKSNEFSGAKLAQLVLGAGMILS